MDPMKQTIVFAAACIVSLGASAACYTVHQKDGKMAYQSQKAPVNMAYPLHETVPVRFGAGATMAFTLDEDASACTSVGEKVETEGVKGDNILTTVLGNVRTFDRAGTDPSPSARPMPGASFPGGSTRP
jgi:hypothetical protein